MKAINEIGLGKACAFISYSFFGWVCNLPIFLPFKPIMFRSAGSVIGNNTVIHKMHIFNHYKGGYKNLTIGDDCFIGEDTSFDLSDKIVLHNQVTISNRVLLLTHTNVGYKDHPLQRYLPKYTKKIEIKRGAFVGANATILPGITVGECSIIAAGSVVTKDVEAKTVVGGVPAKVIKKIRMKL